MLFLINEFIGDPFPSASTNYKKQENSNKQNYVYLLKNDKILKLLITLDENIIKENFIKIKQLISMEDYTISSQHNLWKNNFPIEDNQFDCKGGIYLIPDKNKEQCNFLYLLNNIYNQKNVSNDNFIKLKEEKVNNENKFSIEKNKVLKNIIDNLQIEIIEKYDYKEFINSLNFLEMLASKEKLSIKSELNNCKQLILNAQKNIGIFDSLNINVNLEKNKDFRR